MGVRSRRGQTLRWRRASPGSRPPARCLGDHAGGTGRLRPASAHPGSLRGRRPGRAGPHPATATGRSGATAYLGARRSREPESDADPAPAGAHEGEPTTDAVAEVVEETPIFRSMMSRWLSDPAEAAQDASTTWSPSTADEGWNAAARLEADEPLEESTAGLPLRRRGTTWSPARSRTPCPRPRPHPSRSETPRRFAAI